MRYHDELILQMRKLRLEKGKLLAQKDKALKFKYRSVHLCDFGVVGWEISFRGERIMNTDPKWKI